MPLAFLGREIAQRTHPTSARTLRLPIWTVSNSKPKQLEVGVLKALTGFENEHIDSL